MNVTLVIEGTESVYDAEQVIVQTTGTIEIATDTYELILREGGSE